MPKNLWDSAAAQGLVGLDQLVYRSNLLGSDRAVCNWGGGNTSMKTIEKDFKGNDVMVMWVKGSGSDLATMKAKNFTGLRLDDVLPLFERESMTDEEMVGYLTHCMIDQKHPRMSIETLLHAFLPYPHVDHTHPDAIISLCCAHNGKELAKEIYGDRFVWVDYIRPGFTLSQQIAQGVLDNPKAELVLMEKHGLVTWGDTPEASYDKTIEIIGEAEAYIAKKAAEVGDGLFGGQKYASLDAAKRKEIAAEILPTLRGAVSSERHMITRFEDSDDILTFANSVNAPFLSQVGAACPDHLVHTKRTPLYVAWDPATGDIEALKSALKTGIANYQVEYKAYFDAHKIEGDKIFESSPRVILIPGIGLVSTGKTAVMAEVSAALYHRAISVMGGATVLGDFVSLSAAESFAVEYWPLELYKLAQAPPEVEFSRKVVLITGGAGGIGSATARRFVKEGAHVILADLNIDGANKVADEINASAGADRAFAVSLNVTDEAAVKAAFVESALHYGGVDVLVNNAGLATSSPFLETTLDEWNKNISVLTTGYFLVAKEAFRIFKEQALGGSMVFVGSKNCVYAGKNASAYSTAKAAELHLARCLAAEGGELGIRVNTILPDAILSGSAIWNSGWRNERAAAYGIHPDELEAYYRKRTILNVNILPDDVAESIAFFASSRASKTTGSAITVDGGVPAAFLR